MHRHTEEVLYLLCFRSEGSSANQCSGSEKKISKSELCIGTAPALTFLLCVSKAKIVFTVCCEAQSSKVWPKLELESSGHAKPREPRAGALFWSKTSSGSSDLEPNLERELRFGAKPRAGALIWSQTSSGSAFEVQNLERERIRRRSRTSLFDSVTSNC